MARHVPLAKHGTPKDVRVLFCHYYLWMCISVTYLSIYLRLCSNAKLPKGALLHYFAPITLVLIKDCAYKVQCCARPLIFKGAKFTCKALFFIGLMVLL